MYVYIYVPIYSHVFSFFYFWKKKYVLFQYSGFWGSLYRKLTYLLLTKIGQLTPKDIEYMLVEIEYMLCVCVFVCVSTNTFIFTHVNKCRESYTERSTQRKACLPSALGAPSPHSHLLVYCFFTAALLLFRARRTISYLMLTGVLSSTTRPHWLSSHFFVCM